jgi:hypothetical protein
MVCKESLRLYPSVPIFGRKVVEEMSVSKYDKMILMVIFFACLIFKMESHCLKVRQF